MFHKPLATIQELVNMKTVLSDRQKPTVVSSRLLRGRTTEIEALLLCNIVQPVLHKTQLPNKALRSAPNGSNNGWALTSADKHNLGFKMRPALKTTIQGHIQRLRTCSQSLGSSAWIAKMFSDNRLRGYSGKEVKRCNRAMSQLHLIDNFAWKK